MEICAFRVERHSDVLQVTKKKKLHSFEHPGFSLLDFFFFKDPQILPNKYVLTLRPNTHSIDTDGELPALLTCTSCFAVCADTASDGALAV